MMEKNNNMHHTNETHRKHNAERNTPKTPKHRLPVYTRRLKALPLRSSGGRGDERVRSVATGTVMCTHFLF